MPKWNEWEIDTEKVHEPILNVPTNPKNVNINSQVIKGKKI